MAGQELHDRRLAPRDLALGPPEVVVGGHERALVVGGGLAAAWRRGGYAVVIAASVLGLILREFFEARAIYGLAIGGACMVVAGLATVGFITIGGMYGASYNAAFQMIVMTIAIIVPMGAITRRFLISNSPNLIDSKRYLK